jgi:hypothetical protein
MRPAAAAAAAAVALLATATAATGGTSRTPTADALLAQARAKAATAPPPDARAQPPTDDPYACDPLTDPAVGCYLPWPDDFFNARSWDPAGPPGLRFTNGSLPVDGVATPIDPAAGGWNAADGFSPTGPAMAHLPALSLDGSRLPRLWSIPSSTAPGAASLLLHADSGTPVAHWVELDHASDDVNPAAPYERLALLWPSQRLNSSATYIVAFRGLVDDDGLPLPPSPGFAALRDGTPSDNPALEGSRPRYEGLFKTLAAAGWPRASLTLAWSFTTASTANTTAGLSHMVADALARVAADGGVAFTVTSVVNMTDGGNTSRRVSGTYAVPAYLNEGGWPSLGSRLATDPATGLPVFTGYLNYTWEVIVPVTVAAAGVPAKLV